MVTWQKTFLSAFAAQVLSILGFSFAMPFLPFFIAELGIADEGAQAFWAGITLGASGLTMAVFSPVWGILADRYGRKLMVCRSMIGGTVVLFLMSLSRTVGHLLVCRLLQGAFTGTIAAGVALVAAVTPRQRSGFALGMMQTAVFIGVSLGPLLGGLVADAFGYRASFRVGALFTLIGALIAFYGIREDFHPPGEERAAAAGRPAADGFRAIVGVSGFLSAALVMFGVRLSNTIVNPSFPLIVREILPGAASLNSATGMIMAGAAVAGAISAAGLGLLGDRWGHERILVSCCLGGAFFSAAHFFARHFGFLFAVHVLFGFSIAGMMPAANALIRTVIAERNIGRAYGAATSLSVLGMALGPPLGGWLARAAGMRAPFLLAAAAQLLLAWLVLKVNISGPPARPWPARRKTGTDILRRAGNI